MADRAGKESPVAVVGLGMGTHVLFEGATGVVVRNDELTIEGVDHAGLIAAATNAAREADRLELCGGMSVDDAAAVVVAVSGAAEVRLTRYGFESLEQVAAYKAAFADGDTGDGAFLYLSSRSTPLEQHEGLMVAGVADERALSGSAREALARGAGIIELYGGLGIRAAATVREATGHAIPVGFID